MTVQRPSRRGFTLVELLVTITIIALLSSIVLMGLAGVQQTAKERRTQTQIAKLHEIIMERWRSYETRRPAVIPDPTFAASENAMLRLEAIRETMRMEMPDRITDVIDPIGVLIEPPADWIVYNQIAGTVVDWTPQFQGAECLYLIVSNTYVDEETTALRFFQESEIGDVDGDGMFEILDAWGTPIEFLRWAPGFRSPLQPELEELSTLSPQEYAQNHDPFDVMQVDERTTTLPQGTVSPIVPLTPLIMSAGPDQEFNIQTDWISDSSGGRFRYSQTGGMQSNIDAYGGSVDANDPYVFLPDSTDDPDTIPDQLGQVLNPNVDGHFDNIHNHNLEAF